VARVLITGSSDGLGVLAARLLVAEGHAVVLHARSRERAGHAAAAVPAAEAIVVGDFSAIDQIHQVADQANQLGRFDAVIHNAGVGYRETTRNATVDGLERVFTVNVLAPYLLTALMLRPDRLVYLSSGLHRAGRPHLEDPQWTARAWDGTQAYADSKLLDVVLAFGMARRWPAVLANALEPGWVPTKMGGPDAPDDLALAPVIQAWLAVSADAAAAVTLDTSIIRRPEQRTRPPCPVSFRTTCFTIALISPASRYRCRSGWNSPEHHSPARGELRPRDISGVA